NRRSENVACSTNPLPHKLKYKPNQSLRYETSSAFRKTLTTDTPCKLGQLFYGHLLTPKERVDRKGNVSAEPLHRNGAVPGRKS
ncbi:hypothetical protein, partial [Thalassovita sp.]|uniref:hypothetical protein n=1 Tax=Thalassovita sp. TaxID=1979401 RepID=UPI002B273469